ncbi:regulatory particle non-ATPase [Microbotryomycetes sp. JL201]|nr:regulatory particle non-ATPase [Microbotryomycetes sp. JL201]
MGSSEAQRLYSELVKVWNNGQEGGSANDQQVKQLLAQLKIELSQLGLLFPAVGSDDSKLDTGALTQAREIFEIGAFQSIRSQDVPAFERYLSLLSTFYNDFASKLPKSQNEAPLFALSLLRLLSQNRIADFHTLLETMPKDVVESKEVSWVLKVERSLMEGSYSRVWSLCSTSPSNLPRPEFGTFCHSLVETVRNEIASCDERAYTSLPLRDAKTLLFFDKDDQVVEFAKQVSFATVKEEEVKSAAADKIRINGTQRNWYIDQATSTVHFASSPKHPQSLANGGISTKGMQKLPFDISRELDRERVVQSTLSYAKELETIV